MNKSLSEKLDGVYFGYYKSNNCTFQKNQDYVFELAENGNGRKWIIVFFSKQCLWLSCSISGTYIFRDGLTELNQQEVIDQINHYGNRELGEFFAKHSHTLNGL